MKTPVLWVVEASTENYIVMTEAGYTVGITKKEAMRQVRAWLEQHKGLCNHTNAVVDNDILKCLDCGATKALDYGPTDWSK